MNTVLGIAGAMIGMFAALAIFQPLDLSLEEMILFSGSVGGLIAALLSTHELRKDIPVILLPLVYGGLAYLLTLSMALLFFLCFAFVVALDGDLSLLSDEKILFGLKLTACLGFGSGLGYSLSMLPMLFQAKKADMKAISPSDSDTSEDGDDDDYHSPGGGGPFWV